MASEPDTTTERSHTAAITPGPAGRGQRFTGQSGHPGSTGHSSLRRRLLRSAQRAGPFMPQAAAALALGMPALWYAWSWAAAQAWDSLGLRLAIAALCLPLVACRHWPAALRGALPAYWAAALLVALPWHGTLLLAANGYGSLWILNLLAGATLLSVLQPLTMALLTFATGSVLGLLSLPVLLHLDQAVKRPLPENIATHVFILAIATVLGLRLLQIARLRVRPPVQPQGSLQSAAPHAHASWPGRSGALDATATADPAHRGLVAELVNNSLLERVAALEAEHGPLKARQMLNARERRHVSMMSADIRSFARLVNASNEAAVADLVAQAFAELTSVGQNVAVIKPMGDGLFVYADAQDASDGSIEDAAANVLCLACVFVGGIINVNQTMAIPRGLPELTVGVGLHAGEAVWGNVSGPHLADLTVVGVAPNLTSRLEKLTKHPAVKALLGANAVLMTEEFVGLLRKAGVSLPGMRLLDLVEMDAPISDFPAVSRVWGLDQQQTMAFAGQARQRIRAAKQAKRDTAPKASAAQASDAQAVPPGGHAANMSDSDFGRLLEDDRLDPALRELDQEDLLELLPRALPEVSLTTVEVGGTSVEGGVRHAGGADPTARAPSPTQDFSLDGLTLESLLNDASAAIVYVDRNWVARYCNATMASNLGLRPEQVVGKTPFEYTPTDFKRSIFFDACCRCLSEQRTFSQIGYSTVLSRWVVVNGFPIRGGGLMVAYEASESAIKAHHLETSNAPEPITGLRTKLALEQHVTALLARNEPCDFLLLTLRKFREINEAHGYGVGDKVLMQLASRLNSATRPGEAVFRVGGDVFAWVMARPTAAPGEAVIPAKVAQPEPENDPPVEALERSRQLLTLLQTPVELDGQRIHLQVAIGVASSPQDGDDFQQLLRRAGLALAEAKRQSVSRLPIAAFEASLEEAARKRQALEQDLRQCLDGSQFELVLQPRIHLSNGSVLAAEALLRWRHPRQGLLAPSEFLPVARDMGVLRNIDTWVLRQAIDLCKRLRDFGESFPVSCNLSADALGDTLFSLRVSRDLAAAGVLPQMLEIEINEGDLMLDAQASLRTLDSLKKVGVRLAIDHFGTGYPSSFSHLTSFPIDTIKVDRTYVADLGNSGPGGKFVRSIGRMAHGLSLDVVADGVETEEQVQQLHRLHFDGGQGFALAPPMSWEEFAAFAAIRRIASDSRPNPLTL